MTADLSLAEYSAEVYAHASGEAYGVEWLLVDQGVDVVLAFRGTNTTADALTDVRFLAWPSQTLGVAVHAGFLKRFRAAWRELAFTLAGLDLPLTLTGHSKGGAEAILCAAFLQMYGKPADALVTFGAPRVAYDRRMSGLLPEATRLYINGADPVPDYPFFAHHTHKPVPIGRPRNFRRRWLTRPSARVQEHSINGYISALASLNSREPGQG